MRYIYPFNGRTNIIVRRPCSVLCSVSVAKGTQNLFRSVFRIPVWRCIYTYGCRSIYTYKGRCIYTCEGRSIYTSDCRCSAPRLRGVWNMVGSYFFTTFRSFTMYIPFGRFSRLPLRRMPSSV